MAVPGSGSGSCTPTGLRAMKEDMSRMVHRLSEYMAQSEPNTDIQNRPDGMFSGGQQSQLPSTIPEQLKAMWNKMIMLEFDQLGLQMAVDEKIQCKFQAMNCHFDTKLRSSMDRFSSKFASLEKKLQSLAKELRITDHDMKCCITSEATRLEEMIHNLHSNAEGILDSVNLVGLLSAENESIDGSDSSSNWGIPLLIQEGQNGSRTNAYFPFRNARRRASAPNAFTIHDHHLDTVIESPAVLPPTSTSPPSLRAQPDGISTQPVTSSEEITLAECKKGNPDQSPISPNGVCDGTNDETSDSSSTDNSVMKLSAGEDKKVIKVNTAGSTAAEEGDKNGKNIGTGAIAEQENINSEGTSFGKIIGTGAKAKQENTNRQGTSFGKIIGTGAIAKQENTNREGTPFGKLIGTGAIPKQENTNREGTPVEKIIGTGTKTKQENTNREGTYFGKNIGTGIGTKAKQGNTNREGTPVGKIIGTSTIDKQGNTNRGGASSGKIIGTGIDAKVKRENGNREGVPTSNVTSIRAKWENIKSEETIEANIARTTDQRGITIKEGTSVDNIDGASVTGGNTSGDVIAVANIARATGKGERTIRGGTCMENIDGASVQDGNTSGVAAAVANIAGRAFKTDSETTVGCSHSSLAEEHRDELTEETIVESMTTTTRTNNSDESQTPASESASLIRLCYNVPPTSTFEPTKPQGQAPSISSLTASRNRDASDSKVKTAVKPPTSSKPTDLLQRHPRQPPPISGKKPSVLASESLDLSIETSADEKNQIQEPNNSTEAESLAREDKTNKGDDTTKL